MLFFFQAEDGIRDGTVTGVQTCALPILPFRIAALGGKLPVTLAMAEVCPTCSGSGAAPGATISTCPECKGRGTVSFGRSEERRVGKECRSRWSPDQYEKKKLDDAKITAA